MIRFFLTFILAIAFQGGALTNPDQNRGPLDSRPAIPKQMDTIPAELLTKMTDSLPLFEHPIFQKFEKLISRGGDIQKSNAFQRLAHDLAIKQKPRLAIDAYNRTLDLVPKNEHERRASIAYERLSLLFNQLYKKEVIDLCNKALAEKPIKGGRTEALIYRERGRASYEDDDYKNAISDLMVAKAYFDDQKVEDREFGILLHYIGSVFKRQNHDQEALKYYNKIIDLGYKLKDKSIEAEGLYLSADIYNQMGMYAKDEEYSLRALHIFTDLKHYAMQEMMLMNIAQFYQQNKNFSLAKRYLDSCVALTSRHPSGDNQSTIWRLYAKYYSKKGDYAMAIKHINKALDEAKLSKSRRLILLGDAKRTEAWTHYDHGHYKDAFESLDDYQMYWEKLINEQNSRIVHDMEAKYQNDKKEKEIELLNKDKAISQLALKNSKQRSIFLIIGLIMSIAFAAFMLNRYQLIRRQKKIIEREKKRSDDLLLNILPEEVAEELKAKGSADAKLIDEVSVLFTDFKDFTLHSEKLSPKELVADINECYSAFDLIMEKYGVEKIKTIGDAYMAAGGLPTPNHTHASDVVRAALAIQRFMQEQKIINQEKGKSFFEIRIGVHSGPVVAGIVGVKKFQYDIWGDTVNTASRHESAGEAGKVNISQSTYELIKDEPDFIFEQRGKIHAKGKGDMVMYFVYAKSEEPSGID